MWDEHRRVARVFVGGRGLAVATMTLCELAAPYLEPHVAAARERRLAQDMAQFIHDFQQPLATLTLSLQLLQPSGAQRDHADRCLRSVAQQREMLADLPLLVSGRAGPSAPVVLEELLADVVDDLRAQAQARRVQLRLERRAGAVLEGARSSLRRAFGNVVLNAVQITPAGTSVDVVLKRARRGAVVEVRDRGPGLPPALRERVFEPFVSQRRGGTGLGLAVARAVAEAHEGTVQFVDGRGGLVRFSFPAAQVHLGQAKLAG